MSTFVAVADSEVIHNSISNQASIMNRVNCEWVGPEAPDCSVCAFVIVDFLEFLGVHCKYVFLYCNGSTMAV